MNRMLAVLTTALKKLKLKTIDVNKSKGLIMNVVNSTGRPQPR